MKPTLDEMFVTLKHAHFIELYADERKKMDEREHEEKEAQRSTETEFVKLRSDSQWKKKEGFVFLTEILPEQIDCFVSYLAANPGSMELLLQHLGHPSLFISQAASRVLSLVLFHVYGEREWPLLKRYLEWSFQSFLDNALRKHTVLCLIYLARNKKVSDSVLLHTDIVRRIVDGSRKADVGTKYYFVYLLWVFSFNPLAAAKEEKAREIVSFSLQLFREVEKEKIARLCVFIFSNLILHGGARTARLLVGTRVGPFVEVVRGKKYGDEELSEEVCFLQKRLSEASISLTTFEEYAAELRTKRLEWSPTHTSTLFWEKNSPRLFEKKKELLRILSDIVTQEGEAESVAIATHDLGQFVKFCPVGVEAVKEFAIKDKIIRNTQHPDREVRYQSLIAVQKYINKL
ncbi:MAG: V-type ATPase V1 subunit H [Amphiamblys sp. WSBS2006]|nr:MAG: V-type ATPase V1 subunit H [Amphiamblys sp. WSBS2006]